MQLRKGMRIKCKCDGKEWDDVMVQYEEDTYYLCQNYWHGSGCSDKHGYKYSYCVGRGDDYVLASYDITDIRPYDSNIENVFEGCVVVNDSYQRKVLGVNGEVFFLSQKNDFDGYHGGYTIHELKRGGYKILLPESPTKPEEPMITLPDGRKFSASTIQEALKKYVEG